jgi:hypothetical protein
MIFNTNLAFLYLRTSNDLIDKTFLKSTFEDGVHKDEGRPNEQKVNFDED